MTPEGKLKKAIKDWMKEQGIFYFMPVQSGYGIRGISDIICCYSGKFIAIETKVHPNKPSTLQYRFLNDVGKAGGYTLVAYSLEDVKSLFEIVRLTK